MRLPSRLWLVAGIVGMVIVAFASVVIRSHFAADARLQGKYAAMTQQAGRVIVALQGASDNPDADWLTAPGQIVALGESNKALKLQIGVQNERIDEMAANAVRARAEAMELRRIADKAEAQRRAAYARLSDMSITPGTRDDMMELLNEAVRALDLMREAEAGV